MTTQTKILHTCISNEDRERMSMMSCDINVHHVYQKMEDARILFETTKRLFQRYYEMNSNPIVFQYIMNRKHVPLKTHYFDSQIQYFQSLLDKHTIQDNQQLLLQRNIASCLESKEKLRNQMIPFNPHIEKMIQKKDELISTVEQNIIILKKEYQIPVFLYQLHMNFDEILADL
jgi:hypothetical protein